MAKPVTNWSNNDIKNPSTYTPVSKSVDNWTNNDIKSVTNYTVATKNSGIWNPEKPLSQGYTYDNAIVTYDSGLYDYDIMVINNTVNQRQVTTWGNNT